MEEDERLIPILMNISKQHRVSHDYTQTSATAGNVTADSVDHVILIIFSIDIFNNLIEINL